VTALNTNTVSAVTKKPIKADKCHFHNQIISLEYQPPYTGVLVLLGNNGYANTKSLALVLTVCIHQQNDAFCGDKHQFEIKSISREQQSQLMIRYPVLEQ